MLTEQSTLQPGLYRLPDDPIGPRVLIPAFRAATSVRGAFGWFTAGWIGRLAPGLAEYLNREDTSQIQCTVAPVLYAAEHEAIEQAQRMSTEEAAEIVADVFTNGRVDASALGCHALDCLAWMIATDRLRLRVAIPTPDSNYHPKVWLFDDGEHQVLVRGSANATGRGLGASVEHMDVNVTWSEHSRGRVLDGISMLNDWSDGRSAGIEQVVDLSDALRSGIIETAPDTAPRTADYARAIRADGSPPWAIEQLDRLRARFETDRRNRERPRLQIPDWLEWQTGDFAHQGEAVAAWESSPDPKRGTISMATGAGKTFTALVCATRAQDSLNDSPFLIVVSAPSVPLINQWQAEVRRFSIEPVTPTLSRDTDASLTSLLRSLAGGGTHVAIVTNNLLCTRAFQQTIAVGARNGAEPVATMFIADEAHTLGAEGFVNNKPEFFERRLALSATPERQYDPDGTEAIFDFFGAPVYEFGIGRAIGLCLTPYDYYVHASTLASSELDEFSALTDRIRQMFLIQDPEDDDTPLKYLLIKRRRIIETAQAKLPLLGGVLRRRAPRSLRHALVYASAKNPEQFERIGAILSSLGVRWAPVTEATTRSTRTLNETLRTFTDGGYQVLLAKKVLDEGVDIPSVREAFLVASSTVEREWIQRRGRILRCHPDKPWAILHDFLALPPVDLVQATGPADNDLRKIVQGELSRALSFAAHARNATGDLGALTHLERLRNAYWPESNGRPILQSAGDHVIAPGTPEGIPW